MKRLKRHNKTPISLLIIAVFVLFSYFIFLDKPDKKLPTQQAVPTNIPTTASKSVSPFSIMGMREKLYPGSHFASVQTLSKRNNYKRYIVSYISDGLTQYGLLTVPTGDKPASGWPAILFNHGYIPPGQYSTVDSYASFVDAFASSGYVVFKPDYRGNANSQGTPTQPYVSPDYITDSMNALSSLKKYVNGNPKKIGVFGHSMGGNITLHELVISKNIAAAVLMAGAVGDEQSILEWWDRRFAAKSIAGNDLDTYYIVKKMEETSGTFSSNPTYWNSIDPTEFLSDIIAPVQIQVGTADTAVPVSFSTTLWDRLKEKEKTVEFYEYPGVDHNFTSVRSVALGRAVSFFDKYLK